MLLLRCGSLIEKRRARVSYEGHILEVDTFLGENDGLVIAEIELTTEHEGFVQPPWIGTEVTQRACYYNSALAVCPFTAWAEEERSATGG